MSKEFKAPNGVFVYPYATINGEEITVHTGSKVISNGKRRTATKKLVDSLYSEYRREIIDTQAYEDNKDTLFELRKQKYSISNNEYDIDPIEELPDMVLYTTHTVNGRTGYYMKKGEQTHRMDYALEVLEKIKSKLAPSQIDLIYDLFGRCMSQTDIAEERRTSRQAISAQEKRLINTLKRLFSEYGIDDHYFDNL